MVKGGVPHRRSVVTAMVVVFSLAFAITAARADAYIYWANLGGFGEGQIGRAQLDGDHVDRKFIRGAIGPSAITVDNRHVYWINADGGSIGRAKLNGTKVDQDFIKRVGFAYDLDISGGRIYWTRGQTISTDASIARASLDGSDVERNFIQFDDPARFDPRGATGARRLHLLGQRLQDEFDRPGADRRLRSGSDVHSRRPEKPVRAGRRRHPHLLDEPGDQIDLEGEAQWWQRDYRPDLGRRPGFNPRHRRPVSLFGRGPTAASFAIASTEPGSVLR